MARPHTQNPAECLPERSACRATSAGHFGCHRIPIPVRRGLHGTTPFRYHFPCLSKKSTSWARPCLQIFENLLPDNDNIRRRVAERSGATGHRPYSLLTAIGRETSTTLCKSSRYRGNEAIRSNRGPSSFGREDWRNFKRFRQEPSAVTDGEFESRWRVPRKPAPAPLERTVVSTNGHHAQNNAAILKPQIGMLPDGIDLSIASTTSASNWFVLSIFRRRNRRSRNSTESGRSSSNASTVFGRGTSAFCACRRKTAARLSPCRRASSKIQQQEIVRVKELLKGSDAPSLDQIRFLGTASHFLADRCNGRPCRRTSVSVSRPAGKWLELPLYDVLSAQPNLDASQIRRNQI